MVFLVFEFAQDIFDSRFQRPKIKKFINKKIVVLKFLRLLVQNLMQHF